MTYYGKQSWAQRRWQPERWAIYLFSVAGIRVSLSILSVFLLVLEVLHAVGQGTVVATLVLAGLLFLFVLLHEFGHCFGSRAVGGTADDILMWPLGGLASVDPPDRPWEHLVTTICGPAVNLAVCALLFPFLVYNGVSASNLLNPFGSVYELFGKTWWPIAFTYKINYWLFVFNVFLPVFPMDGGRILQEILWFRTGSKFRSTLIACNVGMFLGAIIGFISLYHQNLLMFGIMLFCVIHSYQVRQQLLISALENAGTFGYDFSEGYRSFDHDEDDERPPRKPSFLQRWRAKRAEKQRKAEADMDREVDRILAKLHDEGLASLTAREKKFLNQASERKRRGH